MLVVVVDSNPVVSSLISKGTKQDILFCDEIKPVIKDNEFFALALKLNCAIWSDDMAFKRQKRIEVLNSKELSHRFGFPWE